MKAAVFGAGNIGRGLIGDALSEAGYSLTYIDADSDLVAMLSERGQFDVVTSSGSRTIEIDQSIHASDEPSVVAAVAGADVVATAVGAPVLQIVAPVIGAGLQQRSQNPVNVIACENVHPNSTALRGHIVATSGEAVVAGVGFPDVVVDRIVPGAPGAAAVVVEDEFEFVIDKTGWLGPLPGSGRVVFSENLAAYKLRKLWLVNGLHALTAWMGLGRGYEYIHEAMADAEIAGVVTSAGRSAAGALATVTDEFVESELEEYLQSVLARFHNGDLPDLTRRVARNPLAKLAADERVLAPARAAESQGRDTTGFAAGIVAGLNLEDDSVEGLTELKAELSNLGWEEFIVSHCGIPRGGSLFMQVKEQMEAVEQRRGSGVITEEIIITNPAGLHARPAAEIVEFAKASEAQIQIHKGDKAANAKSIMSVLALGANTGDTVRVEAEGDGASDVVAALRGIMQSEEH